MPVYINVSVLFLMVFVRELLGVGWGAEYGCWWQRQAPHMLAFVLLWRFVKEKPQILQVYMAVQTLIKHR
jgi:hypothetical protein